jgi:hypothetical protein
MLISYIGADALRDLAAFAVLAFTGLAGTLWMGKLYRTAASRCRVLEDEAIRAEEARQRLRSFTSDIVATLNISLALCATGAGERRRREISRLATTLQSAMRE